MTLFIVFVILAYLLGSICSAIIVCRVFSLPDPRQEGSKNPGATNVLRIAGKHFAALVMAGDVLKGLIPVLLAKFCGAGAITVGFTALAAVIGHMYPIFFEFKGGKGVATALGGLFGIQIFAGTIVAAIWLLVAKFTRYSSLASIISMIFAPIIAIMVTSSVDIFPPLGIMTLLILFKHRNNITRLLDGTEPKITFSSHNPHGILDDVMAAPPPDPHEVKKEVIEESVEEIKAEQTHHPKPEKKEE
ncbi:MAG: glycerol-3-phosphate 1-O-acyltransferase [Legionella sp.]|nr:MAG: glycerol-3-phosphate 1-O-acyltransferase [Legionella sp.]